MVKYSIIQFQSSSIVLLYRSLCGIANTETGGDLYIGVLEDGRVKGLGLTRAEVWCQIMINIHICIYLSPFLSLSLSLSLYTHIYVYICLYSVIIFVLILMDWSLDWYLLLFHLVILSCLFLLWMDQEERNSMSLT